MPRYAHPDLLPTEMKLLAAMIGANEARLAILLDLLDHPAGGRVEIAERTGLNRQLVLRHLHALDEQGVISSDVGAGPQATRYTANREVIAQRVRSLNDRLIG